MYVQTSKRLILCLTDRDMECIVGLALESQSQMEFLGPRPAGYLESEGQRMLEDY